MKITFPTDLTNFTMFRYPGGELQVRLTPAAIPLVRAAECVDIDARVADSAELIGLALLSSAIRGVKPGIKLRLNIPYLPYARADRRFVDGDCHGLEVFGEILRTCRFDEINVLDVHNASKMWSHVSSFIRDCRPDVFIWESIGDFATRTRAKRPAILLPDAGAAERYKRLGASFTLICAQKQRNATTGVLTGFYVPMAAHAHDAIMIVDDICDGGGTFRGIAQALVGSGGTPHLGLYVTHGIFSQGLAPLFAYFNHIYTTNSVATQEVSPHLTTYGAWRALR